MNYEALAVRATTLLTKFGKPLTLRRVTPGAYDPATGSSTDTTTDGTRQGVLLNVNRVQYGQRLRNGSSIQAGDRRCLLDASGAAPDENDLIVDGATIYTILDAKEENPAGTPLYYDLVIRR